MQIEHSLYNIPLGEVLGTVAEHSPDKVALIDANTGLELTYRDYLNVARTVAGVLQHLGITPSDIVLVFMKKSAELVLSFLGISLAGAVYAPAIYNLSIKSLARKVEEIQPKLILYEADFIHQVKSVLNEIETEIPQVLFKMNGKHPDFRFSKPGQDLSFHFEPPDVCPEQVVYLNYTSGSTGSPKAVPTNSNMIAANTLSSIKAFEIQPDDVHLVTFAAFAHPHELFARALYTGGTAVLSETIFPKTIARVISKYQVTCLMGIAPIFDLILSFTDSPNYEFGSLRLAESGGMPTPHALVERMVAKLEFPITPVWGSTETSGVAVYTAQGCYKPGCLGFPAPYYDIEIHNDAGKPAEPYEVGEMVISGPAVATEYFKSSDESKATFVDGKYYTGDLVYMDEDGMIFFKGRRSGMMKVAGLKVYPQEIEQELLRHPSIDEAAVVPMSDITRGEVPQVAVVLHPGEKLSVKEIKDYCAERLPSYKIPKSIVIVDYIPQIGLGKLNRNLLKMQLQGKEAPPDPVVKVKQQLDKIDLQILRLINQRGCLALRLKELKEKEGERLFSIEEEERTISRLLGYNAGPFHDASIEEIFKLVLKLTLQLEP